MAFFYRGGFRDKSGNISGRKSQIGKIEFTAGNDCIGLNVTLLPGLMLFVLNRIAL